MKNHLAVALFGVAAALAASPLSAQSTNYYILNGDSQIGYIVRNGAVQSTFSTSNSGNNSLSQYALRFQGDNFLTARRNGSESIEYNAVGTPTGVTNNNAQNVEQLLDGGTDGTFTYAARCVTDRGIYRGNMNFGGLALFAAIDECVSGVTYGNGSIWATTTSGLLANYSMTGQLLQSFQTFTNSIGALAYESSTNSLWFGQNGTNKIYNYSLAGAQLAQVNVTGGLGGNFWGGEMRNATSVVPEPSTYLLVAAGLAGVFGLARRKERVNLS